MLGFGLAEISLEGERVEGGDPFARRKPCGYFNDPAIPTADAYLARFKAFGGAHKHDRFVLERLEGRDRHRQCRRFLIDQDFRGHESTRPPLSGRVLDRGTTRAERVSLSSRGLTNMMV